MSDTAEILHELRAIRLMQQAALHVLYTQSGVDPNPIPWTGFLVLAGLDAQDPRACPDVEASPCASSPAPQEHSAAVAAVCK